MHVSILVFECVPHDEPGLLGQNDILQCPIGDAESHDLRTLLDEQRVRFADVCDHLQCSLFIRWVQFRFQINRSVIGRVYAIVGSRDLKSAVASVEGVGID